MQGRGRLSAATTVLVTLITVNAVVDVSRDVLVMEVGRVVVPMTARALEYRIIVRVRVTCSADVICIPVTRWELRVLRVIERGSRPCSRVVTVLASGREELRLR